MSGLTGQRGGARRKLALVVGITLALWLALMGVTAAFLGVGSFTTSWGERVHRDETYLSVEGETLTQDDLEHIAHLRRLSTLRLVNCNVAECRLPELRFSSKRLYRVDLSGTRGLWDLSFLSDLTAESLDLSGCPGVSDLSPLNWDVLSELDVSDTEVTDLGPVAGSQLHYLTFAHTEVSDLAPLAKAPQLYEVDGSYSKVSSLSPLGACGSLWGVSFSGCPLTTLEGTWASTYLREVRLADTALSDLSFLSGCQQLRALDLTGCSELRDLSWIDSHCHGTLEMLGVGGTQLTADDLSWLGRCPNLQELVLDGLPLGTLDLCRGLTRLERLSALGCGLTDITGLRDCTSLTMILLGFNELAQLEGLPDPQPEWPQTIVDLSYNHLTSLKGLPVGSYRALFLQGNDANVARTLPAGVECYDVVGTWFSGVDDSRLRDTDAYAMIYLLDVPADKAEALEETFGSWHLSCVDEEELAQLLEQDGLEYRLGEELGRYAERLRTRRE